MKIIASRHVPYVDEATLEERAGYEVLLRDRRGGFALYMATDADAPGFENRMVTVGLREALLWLNEPAGDHGSFWH